MVGAGQNGGRQQAHSRRGHPRCPDNAVDAGIKLEGNVVWLWVTTKINNYFSRQRAGTVLTLHPKELYRVIL